MLATQRDFETLVTTALQTGHAKFTFAMQQRVHLHFVVERPRQWVLIIVPMPPPEKLPSALQQDPRVGAATVAVLASGAVNALSVKEPWEAEHSHPWQGKFGELKTPEELEPPGELPGDAFISEWEGTTHRPAPAPGRNDSCPCGSGRKFKRCHGARDEN